MKLTFEDRILDFAAYCGAEQRGALDAMLHEACADVNDVSGRCEPACKMCRLWRSVNRHGKALDRVRKILKTRMVAYVCR